MAVNNFDKIAPLYDRIAKVIFGKALLESQISFFNLMESDSNLLILGGGSGALLELLSDEQTVDYVEKSDRMIQMARNRNTRSEISYINRDFLYWEPTKKYDFIVCPFFLDCFNPDTLEIVIAKLKQFIKPEGHLLVADFEKKSTNKILLVLMHLFLRITANLESRRLSSIHEKLVSHHFEMTEEIFFYQNMIFSRVYRNL